MVHIHTSRIGRICGQIFCARWFASHPRLSPSAATDTLVLTAPLISFRQLDSVNKVISGYAIFASAKPIITLDNIPLTILPTTTFHIPTLTPTLTLHLIIVLPTLIALLPSATSHRELRDLLRFINPFLTRHGNMERSNRFLKRTKMMDRVDLNHLRQMRRTRKTMRTRREGGEARSVR